MRATWIASAVALVAISGGRASGYGEDVPADNHSTAHYDMALAMARCAGFTASDARTIAEADEVTDTLAYGATAFNFTDRTGPFKAYFHFPEAGGSVDARGDGSLRSWAAGSSTLTDATGATINICDSAGTCCDTAGQCVTMGSLEAIGIWLHAVADYWSHHACIQAGGTNHEDYDTADPAQAAYCVSTMHGHEWGRRDTTEYNATLQANAIMGLQAMRDALAAFATGRGMTACGAISDGDLMAFASATSSALRTTAAMALYTACDSVTTCGAATGGDASSGTDGADSTTPSSGCGCSSSLSASQGAVLLVIGLVAFGRRRRR